MSSLRNCPDDSDDSDFVWDGFCFFVQCFCLDKARWSENYVNSVNQNGEQKNMLK